MERHGHMREYCMLYKLGSISFPLPGSSLSRSSSSFASSSSSPLCASSSMFSNALVFGAASVQTTCPHLNSPFPHFSGPSLSPHNEDHGGWVEFHRRHIPLLTHPSGYVAPEYAMRGHLTEKADVFSFGIVALEVVSGKANMDPAIPINTVYILDWASILLNEDKLLDLVDPKLGDDYCVAEVLRVIQVALLCTQGLAAARPSMSLVVSMLLGEASIQGLHKRNSECSSGELLPYSIEKISSNTSQTTGFYFHSYDSSTTPSNIQTTDTHLSWS